MGELVGGHESSWQKYEKGSSLPGSEVLQALAKLSFNVNWILTGKGDMYRESLGIKEMNSALKNYNEHDDIPLKNTEPWRYEDDEFVFVPQVRGEISAGHGLVADNTIEIKVAFRRDWIQRKGNPQDMSLIRVSGDSMEPTLLSGDLVLIDHGSQHIDPQGGIYAIAMDHEIMIKRVQVLYHKKVLKIISDNGRYEPMELGADQIKVNGKVIWYGRELER